MDADGYNLELMLDKYDKFQRKFFENKYYCPIIILYIYIN